MSDLNENWPGDFYRLRETLPAPNIVTADHYGPQKPPNLVAFIDELRSHIRHGFDTRGPDRTGT